MEENLISFTKKQEKLESYLSNLNSKDETIIQETLLKIKAELMLISNMVLDYQLDSFFLNQFSTRLISVIMASKENEMVPILMFYLLIIVENLENKELLSFLTKISQRITNKSEHFYTCTQRDVHKDLIVCYILN
jgi:hypothetical protein